MSIGAALAILTPEFPAVRISKIRFLEEQGIVSPHRTASGYRTYSQADVERLRFALAAQRDSFLPLRIIRERLQELDLAGAGAPAPGARVVTEDGELTIAATNSRMTSTQLAQAAGTSEPYIKELVDAGVLVADFAGKHSSASVKIVHTAQQLAEQGIDARHLRTTRAAAQRHVDLIQQLTAPTRSRRHSTSLAEASEQAQQLGQLLADLHSQLITDGIDRL